MKPNDYLWDRSGEPDPEVERLEQLLGELRYTGEAPPIAPSRSWRPWAAGALALAAAALLTVLGWAALPTADPQTPAGEPAGFAYDGTACAGASCLLGVGEWLETGEHSASVQVADIGQLELAPGSRLRLKATGESEHRLELAQGKLSASVFAPPRLLVVETPAATAVDLGCVYDLEVDDRGNGLLAVHSGWVALETEHFVATVPAGAAARIRAGAGPGTPYFRDADVQFLRALATFDVAPDSPSLATLLGHARARDTLSLFHLLYTVDPTERPEVLARIRALSPHLNWQRLPAQGPLQLEGPAMDDLFTELTTTWEG